MEPIAVGFLRMIAGAAFLAVVVGAIGGACVWRARTHLVLGALLTASLFLLLLVADQHWRLTWIRVELVWGAPLLSLTFLVGVLSARWLDARTRWRSTWVALGAFGLALAIGLAYLLLFRLDMEAPLRWAWIVDVGLVLLLAWSRTLAMGTNSTHARDR